MEKKLKIISNWDDNIERVLKAAGDNNLDHSSGWYIHGDLEDLLHYDIGTIYNMSDFPGETREVYFYKTQINNQSEVDKLETYQRAYLHGIYPVEVYGVEEECIGYFWITDERECTVRTPGGEKVNYSDWLQRGLVCLKSDQEAIKYAEKCYAENRSHL